jgi:hypothetical protein
MMFVAEQNDADVSLQRLARTKHLSVRGSGLPDLAKADAKAKKDVFADFTINCVWAALGMFLALLIVKESVDPQLHIP